MEYTVRRHLLDHVRPQGDKIYLGKNMRISWASWCKWQAGLLCIIVVPVETQSVSNERWKREEEGLLRAEIRRGRSTMPELITERERGGRKHGWGKGNIKRLCPYVCMPKHSTSLWKWFHTNKYLVTCIYTFRCDLWLDFCYLWSGRNAYVCLDP